MWYRLWAVIAVACAFTWQVPGVLAEPARARLLLQVSFVSGFQYYEGKRLFRHLAAGDEVRLIREPDNAYDANAIRVEWNNRVLGYLPGNENRALARQMDFGHRLRGRIVQLSRHRDPNRRVEIEVYLQY